MARVVVPVTSLTPPKATLTTSLAGSNNDLVYTALVGGPAGNSIQVEYIVSGTNTAFALNMLGFKISVTVATDGGGAATTTAATLTTSLNSNSDFTRLATVANAAANDGTGVLAALTATNLAGGSLQTSQPSQVNSDSTNGHYFPGNDGLTVIEAFNNNAAPKTVSILYSPYYAAIATVASQVETIPNATTRILGPFAPSAFGQNSTNDVYFDCNVATDMKFRVYKTVRAS